MGADAGQDRLRIAALIVEPLAYRLVAAWAERRGHTLALLVTTPGPPQTWHNRDYHDLVGLVPARQDVLVSTRMRTVVAPLLGALAPDLVVSFTFPHRIPPEVIAVPRLGAVNLHPTPLPAYRGPNPRRMLFDGAPTLGAALHRVEAGFDTGAILSRRERPVPPAATAESVRETWLALLGEALDEGVVRALAGEPGEAQDESRASYSPPFSREERRLDWSWPVALLARRVLALNLFHPEAWAVVDGRACEVRALAPGPRSPAPVPAGTLLARAGDRATVATADGSVEIVAVPLDEAGGERGSGAAGRSWR